MLVTTGRKEKLSVSKGSEIEVSSNENANSTGNIWYSALLDENLAKSKRKKLLVRHLNPISKEAYSTPLITSTIHRLIRPVPPQDPFLEVDFEEGDMVDAVYKGAWWSGCVVKVLGHRRFLVYTRFEPDVIEVKRMDLRPHFVWENDEWFRCERKELVESEFSAGKSVEVRTEVEEFGEVWVPAIAIKKDDDGDEEEERLLVKYKSLSGEEDEYSKMSVPYSKIRPLPGPVGLRAYKLMDKVEALNEFGWCRGVVSTILCGNRYTVQLGENEKSNDFHYLKLRPLVEWKDGAWQTEEKVVDDTDEESPLVAEKPGASTRIRVTVRRNIKASGAGKKVRTTRSSSFAMQNPPPVSSNGGDVAEAVKESVVESETPLDKTADLSEELGSKMADVVMNEDTPVISQPEIATTKEVHPSVVLGVAAASMKKSAAKTQGKTSPRKKLQAMKNQKGSTNDSAAEKAPEEPKSRENVNKRKRGQPRKFVSSEPKQKAGVSGNGSKAATTELADMADDDRPLASWIHGQFASRTPDPLSVVEKHVVETPPVNDTTMVLPFAKKSPLWKVIESMEAFKSVPQRPHFSPLLECEEVSREGDAIGAMVTFTGLIEKLNKIQVHDPVSVINSINECFLKLEKHGFSVTEPLTRIGKLLSAKESQSQAMEELKVFERKISEADNKRRKCEEDIEDVVKMITELQRQEVLLKESKVTMDKEIARMQSHAVVLDQKVQNVEEEFQAIVAAPWN
ncbi:hypothetical protein AALP_AA5G281400 [Arabis alpina]|uniref:Agenet domain-containing protein n=1 Tax=Arabis alpina TaxID=50452 RepID=A0A087GZW1_ARAAL|nr:hypothetical protein AALP_AA5G281400 [Arabis alpina]